IRNQLSPIAATQQRYATSSAIAPTNASRNNKEYGLAIWVMPQEKVKWEICGSSPAASSGVPTPSPRRPHYLILTMSVLENTSLSGLSSWASESFGRKVVSVPYVRPASQSSRAFTGPWPALDRVFIGNGSRSRKRGK